MKHTIRSEVGVRELRDNLSRYLARVKEGEEVVVTDHGHAVAYLVPKPRSGRLAALIAAGGATPPTAERRSLPEPVEFAGSDDDLDDLVAQQRR